jgi:hypothetical protein
MKLKTFTNVLFLIIILAFVAYLDSPYSFLNKKYIYSADQPVMVQPVKGEPPSNVPFFEEKLEKSEKVAGYIVETYQEYEVYKDKDGNVGKTDTLKYWDYSSKDR